MKRILTIAGSDSSGGAGVQRDARAIHAHGGHALTAVTSITSQTEDTFFGAVNMPEDAVAAQIEAAFAGGTVAAAKTGMLPTAAIVETAARILREKQLSLLVIDPLVFSSSGVRLIDKDAEFALRRSLFPQAYVVTPNIAEASALSGVKIDSVDGMKTAAEHIAGMGPRAVVVTGGHAEFALAVDVSFEDGNAEVFHPKEPVNANGIHGSGCAFSAAIAALLAAGHDLSEAVSAAKAYVTKLIATETAINN